MADEKKRPSDLFKNLEFDPVTMDTKLALDYFKSKNNCFKSVTDPYDASKDKNIKDKFNNNIKIIPNIIPRTYNIDNLPLLKDIGKNTLKTIAVKVEEKAELFAQLEYLYRNVPQENVKKFDIDLLVKLFRYYSAVEHIPEYKQVIDASKTMSEWAAPYDVLFLVLNQWTPLVELGRAVAALAASKPVMIHACQDSAVVALLFQELCTEAGLPAAAVRVEIYSSEELERVYYKPGDTGCTAVVTDSADLDSAIEAILGATSSSVYPWRLKNIIVQESVYEDFKKKIQFKIENLMKNKKKDDEAAKMMLVSLYSGLHCYYSSSSGLRVYVFDDVTSIGSVVVDTTTLPLVPVEAYRTTQELSALLRKNPAFALSLWCADISVANEIALGNDTSTVWINSYGLFEPSVPIYWCRSKYSRVVIGGFSGFVNSLVPLSGWINSYSYPPTLNTCIEKYSQKLVAWGKYSVQQRLKIIALVVKKYKEKVSQATDDDYLIALEDLENLNEVCQAKSSVSVVKNTICLCLNEPVGAIAVEFSSQWNVHQFRQLMLSVVRGNGIFGYFPTKSDILKNVLVELTDSEVPLWCCRDFLAWSEMWSHPNITLALRVKHFEEILFYKPKVVWSRFGETFAN